MDKPVGKPLDIPADFDWQGHRGARGLLPENSLPGFAAAVGLGVTTLELDVVVSADGQLVVSHEPWMSHEICRTPTGAQVDSASEALQHAIYRMAYADIRQYDCGSWGHPRFAQQQRQAMRKPLLHEVVALADSLAQAQGRAPLRFNIETKSTPAWQAAGLVPAPEDFTRRLVAEIRRLGIGGRASIQSFDVRTLQAARAQAPEIERVLLVENTDGLAANLARLGSVPAVYSPYYELVDSALVAAVHAQGMRIIPWTVNEEADMRRLVALGVDGLISDYPDRYRALRGAGPAVSGQR